MVNLLTVYGSLDNEVRLAQVCTYNVLIECHAYLIVSIQDTVRGVSVTK